MPSDLEIVKSLIEDSNRTFEEFKAANDARLQAVEKRAGAPAPEKEAEVDRINAALTNFEAKIAEAEARLARPPVPGKDDVDPNAPEAKELKAEFFNFMRGRAPTDVRAALVEDATGEILVPEDLDAAIRLATEREAIMRSLARVRTTTSNRVRRRSLNELMVGWGKLELGDALVESSLVPDGEFLYVEDLYGLTKIGEDELMDSDANLEPQVESSFSRAVAAAEDLGYTRGLGHAAKQPEGLFMPGNGVARVAAGQVNGVTIDDFITLYYATPAKYRNNGAYLVSSATELAMRKLKDNNGLHLWQPSVQAGKPATFNGRPVHNQDDIASIPAGGAGAAVDVAAYGDFQVGYVIVDRLGMTVKRMAELFALQGMIGFLVHRRTTGGISEADALRILAVPRA